VSRNGLHSRVCIAMNLLTIKMHGESWLRTNRLRYGAGVTLGSLSHNLTRLLQDLIGSILDTIGSSYDSPQPEKVREGMVCFGATLLHDSRLPLAFVEHPAERDPRNGQEDSCACYLQHAQAPDA
jgi:hypothetical protein